MQFSYGIILLFGNGLTVVGCLSSLRVAALIVFGENMFIWPGLLGSATVYWC